MKEKSEEYFKARINILKHRRKENYRIIQKLQRQLDRMSHQFRWQNLRLLIEMFRVQVADGSPKWLGKLYFPSQFPTYNYKEELK